MNLIYTNLKRVILASLTGFFLNVQAQDAPEVYFRSQGDSTTFKLLWAPIKWPENVKGFNVKRKSDQLDAWTKLNDAPIIPATNRREDLSYVTNSNEVLSRIQRKYDSLISNNLIRNMDEDVMYESFLSDTSKVKFLLFLASIDFDYALIHGYAYIDEKLEEGESYIYGLFPVDDQLQEWSAPLHMTNFNSGNRYTYEIPSSPSVRRLTRKKGLEVRWRMPTERLRVYDVKGFHVFLQDSLGRRRLTNTPIRVNMAEDTTDLLYLDNEMTMSENQTFTAVPINIFNTSGKGMEFYYRDVSAPESIDIRLSAGDDAEQRVVNLKIAYSPDVSALADKVNILIRERPGEKQKTLVSQRRSLTAHSLFQTEKYRYYQVELILKNGDKYYSNELLIYKDLSSKPATPTGLRASIVQQGSSEYVYLRWDPDLPSNASNVGYELYTDGIMGDGLAREGSIGLIQAYSYKYEIKEQYGRDYHFAIRLINDGSESEMSDTVRILVPSKVIPRLTIWPIDKQENIVTLNWNYPDGIGDLTGFRLYQNGELIVNEDSLTKDQRTWRSAELTPGSYSYEIEAVTSFGLRSSISRSVNFNITE